MTCPMSTNTARCHHFVTTTQIL